MDIGGHYFITDMDQAHRLVGRQRRLRLGVAFDIVRRWMECCRVETVINWVNEWILLPPRLLLLYMVIRNFFSVYNQQ